jgi:hypothetical protein
VAPDTGAVTQTLNAPFRHTPAAVVEAVIPGVAGTAFTVFDTVVALADCQVAPFTVGFAFTVAVLAPAADVENV